MTFDIELDNKNLPMKRWRFRFSGESYRCVDIRQNVDIHFKVNCSFMTVKKCPCNILQKQSPFMASIYFGVKKSSGRSTSRFKTN